MVTLTTGAARTTSTATSSTRLAVTVLAAAALAACGGGGPAAAGHAPAVVGPPSAAALAAVQGAVAGALSRTATVSMTLSSGGALFGASASRVDGTGTFDFAALRGALSFRPSGSRTSEPVVFTPTAVYVRPPPGGGLLPAGKSWTVADFSDPEALTSNFPRLIAQAEIVNPALTIGELLWGGSAAAPAGHETIGGQDAARYAVTVDLNHAADAVTGPGRIPFSRALATEVVALGGSVDASAKHATTTVSAWVSANGRLARVAGAPPAAGVGTVTTNLSGFGVAV